MNVCDWLTGVPREGWLVPTMLWTDWALRGEAVPAYFPPSGSAEVLQDGRSCRLEGKWRVNPWEAFEVTV